MGHLANLLLPYVLIIQWRVLPRNSSWSSFLCVAEKLKRCQTYFNFQSVVLSTEVLTTPGYLLENHGLHPRPVELESAFLKTWGIVDLQYCVSFRYTATCIEMQNLHFNKILRWFVSTVEIQKHCIKLCSFWPESLGKNNSNKTLIFQSLIKLWFCPHSSYSLPYYFSNLIFLLPNSYNYGIRLY